MPTSEPTTAELIAAARASIDRLRDYARESTEELPRRMGMDFRERDRHVMAIHAVIDRLEGFPAELVAARRAGMLEAAKIASGFLDHNFKTGYADTCVDIAGSIRAAAFKEKADE